MPKPVSTIPANPTVSYRRAPSIMGQLGQATSYVSRGEQFYVAGRSSYQQLVAWDNCRRREPVVQNGLNTIVRSILKKIGDYSHPDPLINDFVNANLETRIKRWFGEAAETALWSGNSTSETLWEIRKGPDGRHQAWVKDLSCYHPLQITYILNDFGRLTHGEPTQNQAYKSGIWVPYPSLHRPKRGDIVGSQVRIPQGQFFQVSLGGGGVYGTSILTTITKYHLFKEAFRDMYTVALDRYGNPLVWVSVPNQSTQEMTETPGGELVPVSLRDQVKSEIENLENGSFFVVSQTDPNNKVEFKSLTTGNNYGDTFERAIALCDQNMRLGMNIPNLLMEDSGHSMGSSGASERQLEVFEVFITSILESLTDSFLHQVVRPLIDYNFNPELHNTFDLGTINFLPSRFADYQILYEGIYKMVEAGFIDSSNEVDFNWARDMLGAPRRSHTRKDKPRGKNYELPPAPSNSTKQPTPVITTEADTSTANTKAPAKKAKPATKSTTKVPAKKQPTK